MQKLYKNNSKLFHREFARYADSDQGWLSEDELWQHMHWVVYTWARGGGERFLKI